MKRDIRISKEIYERMDIRNLICILGILEELEKTYNEETLQKIKRFPMYGKHFCLQEEAKEQNRMDLPLATVETEYWNIHYEK